MKKILRIILRILAFFLIYFPLFFLAQLTTTGIATILIIITAILISNPLFNLDTGLNILDFDISFDPIKGFEIETRASYFRLGTQVQGVTFPGESLSQNGISIKNHMKAPSKLFLGLTGETLGYFISSYDWNIPKNNYEEILSMGKDVGDIIQHKLTLFIENDNLKF